MVHKTSDRDLFGQPIKNFGKDRKKQIGVSTVLPITVSDKLKMATKQCNTSENIFYQACVSQFLDQFAESSKVEKNEFVVLASPRRGAESAINKNVYLDPQEHTALKSIAGTHGYRVADLVLTALHNGVNVPPTSSGKSAAA